MKIGLVLSPGFNLIGPGAVSAFEVANKYARGQLYEIEILSEQGGPLDSSIGMQAMTRRFGDDAYDTLMISAGMEVPVASPGVIRYLRAAAERTRRIASICLASFLLGDAGLLNGRRATTHWRYAGIMQERFPSCQVDADKIYIEDGQIWTSAGMTAGVDLVIGMIERDHGVELARLVAKGMVMYHRRSGGQSQHSALLDLDAREDRVQRALNYARANLRKRLTIEELAGAASLSPRQFARLFRSETGATPAKAVEMLRVEAAKLMLEQTRLPIEEIAREVGFENRERMRLAFARVRGEAPRAIRNEAGPLATISIGSKNCKVSG